MTPTRDHMESLQEHFRSPGLVWLVDRLVTRIEQSKPLDCGTVTLRDADPDQRRAVDDLLGRRSTSGRTLTVHLAGLCKHLCLDDAQLRGLVTAIRGPVKDLRAARDAQATMWETLLARWRTRLSHHPHGQRWLEGLSRSGVLKRLVASDADGAETLLAQAWEIIDNAPHEEILLASLAARTTGDSHALDRGRPVGTLCLRAISELTGIDGVVNAELRREAWEAIGVTLDDLSAPALCLNLPVAEASEQAPWIRWHLERGEPFYLSWRLVRCFVPAPDTGAVYVCENPAVVSEAANRLGAHSRPLVCLNGQPSAPVKTLLRRLTGRGIPLHLRADFDWTGLRIVDQLYDPRSTRIWRMTVADYQACKPSQPLTGSPHIPVWGTALAADLQSAGLAAYEEELIDSLITDLQRPH